MASTYCYKKGQSFIHNWKLRYMEYDAAERKLTYFTHKGGHVQGEFIVSGVKADHADTPGHASVFEILHEDGKTPLMCAGIAKKSKDPTKSFPTAKEIMVRAIEESLKGAALPDDLQAESTRIRQGSAAVPSDKRTHETMLDAAKHLTHAWEMGDEESYRSFASTENGGMKMVIPAYGVDVQGFDTIWAMRKSQGEGPLDVHSTGDSSMVGSNVLKVVVITSDRETGELKAASNVEVTFTASLQVSKFYLTERTHETMLDAAKQLTHAWEMGDEESYRSFASTENGGMKMVIPAYGVDVQGFDTIWAMRKSQGEGPLDVHSTGDSSMVGSNVLKVVVITSDRETGELKAASNVEVTFTASLQVSKFYLTERTHETMLDAAKQLTHAWEMGDEESYRSFASTENGGMKMVIPAYGVDVQGFDTIWAMRKSQGEGPLDVHSTGDSSMVGSNVLKVVVITSDRETGELKAASNVEVTFTASLQVSKFYLTERTHETMLDAAKQLTHAWEMGDEESYRSFASTENGGMKMVIPAYGVDVQGFDTIWAMRKSQGEGPLDVHSTGDSSMVGSNVLKVVVITSDRETGELKAASNVEVTFTASLQVSKFYLTVIKPIIVLGSSGNVGKATLAALAGANVPATAGVRDSSTSNAKNAPLLAMGGGISLAKADMSKPETLRPVISEGSTVFVATPGHIDRTALTLAAVEAAVAAKAGHIVVISLPVVTVETSTIFGDQFKAIEAAVKGCGIPFTIVRLPMFMDNNLGQPIKDMAAVFMPLVPDQEMSSISVKDIGCGVANVLRAPEKFSGRTLNLAGVTTNMTATAAAYSKVLGKTVSYTQVPPSAAKESMMGAGWPEWMVDGVLELIALINEKDPSGLIPTADDNTLEVLGRDADSPEAFMEGFKGMFVAKP